MSSGRQRAAEDLSTCQSGGPLPAQTQVKIEEVRREESVCVIPANRTAQWCGVRIV